MSRDAVIILEKSCASADETRKQERTLMKLVDENMIKDGEIIPKDTVSDAVHKDFIYRRNFGSMPYAARKGIVTTMNAVGVYLAGSCCKKMTYTVMHSIEESLAVKGTAFEYDCYLKH